MLAGVQAGERVVGQVGRWEGRRAGGRTGVWVDGRAGRRAGFVDSVTRVTEGEIHTYSWM